MKFSEAWLRELVDPPVDSEALIERLTMAGAPVDEIANADPGFSKVVVAEVLAAKQHPDGDRLRVCRVADGSGAEFEVVCGAPNARVGLRTAFAKTGARLPEGLVVRKNKIRGVASHGMLCSSAELALGEDADGIIELPGDAPLGTALGDYLQLNDRIIDVELTPNRGDLLSMSGIAREVSALFGMPMTAPPVSSQTAVHDRIFPIEIVAGEACPVYAGRILLSVDVTAPSPIWLRERLRRSGLRSIGAIVDITNYVMMELGQPLHAFDLDKLCGGIVVRQAEAGECLTLLDAQEVELEVGTLVIADRERAVAMAGVMGGIDTAVGDGTHNVFLEAAFFAPTPIAGKARHYKMHTDASHRFERGVSFDLQTAALERASELLVQICGGEPGPISVERRDEFIPARPVIGLRTARVEQLLGFTIPAKEIEQNLRALGMQVEVVDEGWHVVPPNPRFDLVMEADLIEEIVRLHGFDKMPSHRPRNEARIRPLSAPGIVLARYRQALAERGFSEAVTYSFVDPLLQQRLEPDIAALPLSNPISSNMSVMRTSLWPGLLQALDYNIKRQQERVRLFELGGVFRPLDGGAHLQSRQIGLVMTGAALPKQWGVERRELDFADLHGEVSALVSLGGQSNKLTSGPSNHSALHPGSRATLSSDDLVIAEFGALHPEIAKYFGINQKIYLGTLALDLVVSENVPLYRTISKFPTIRRDISILVDKTLPAGELLTTIWEGRSDLLRDLQLFDVFEGEGIDSRKKSLAIGLIFQGDSSTLTDSDVDTLRDQVLGELAQKFGATLR